MRASCVLFLLSAAARGLAAKARLDLPSAGLLQLPALYGRNKGAQLLPAENEGLTRAVLSCRGGSVTATTVGAGACRGDGGDGRVVLPAVADDDTRISAKRGWGQLRRSLVARTSSSKELLGPRGGCLLVARASSLLCHRS